MPDHPQDTERCGHPPDPVAEWRDGRPWCHCGAVLDRTRGMPMHTPPEAPGPLVPCANCGCYVAVPPRPADPGATLYWKRTDHAN